MFVFAKVIPKTLLVPFLSGHGVVTARSADQLQDSLLKTGKLQQHVRPIVDYQQNEACKSYAFDDLSVPIVFHGQQWLWQAAYLFRRCLWLSGVYLIRTCLLDT